MTGGRRRPKSQGLLAPVSSEVGDLDQVKDRPVSMTFLISTGKATIVLKNSRINGGVGVPRGRVLDLWKGAVSCFNF